MGFPGDNALTLNEKMVGTYLIQRLQKPAHWKVGDKTFDNPFSFGGGLKNGGLSDKAMDLIRDIFSFDYMGSAEFEFGAVPQALRFIAEQAANKNLIDGEISLGKDKTVYYLCPLEYADGVASRIRQLYRDEYKFQLKERCGLADYFNREDEWAKRTCGWLELDNGFMFFTDKDMFIKTCTLFGIQLA